MKPNGTRALTITISLVGRWIFGVHRDWITGPPAVAALAVSQEGKDGRLEGAITIIYHSWGWKQPSFAPRWGGGVPSGK